MVELVAAGEYVALEPGRAFFAPSEEPVAVALADGGLLAVWVHGTGVRAQIYDRHGAPVGLSFNLNELTDNRPANPEVTGLAGGGFVAAWYGSTSQDDIGVIARVFDASGAPITSEFNVNTTLAGGQQQPTVTALTSGGFVVAWTDQNANLNGSGIRAQRFDASGAKIGPEFGVGVTSSGNQVYPRATNLVDGGFVLSWADGFRGYFARFFDSQGQPISAPISFGYDGGGVFDIATLASGDVLLTWPFQGEIRAQLVTSKGAKYGPEFQVNISSSLAEMMPNIAALQSGGFMVSWRAPTGAINHFQEGEIRAQLFDASGRKVGDEFLVNTKTEGGQSEPAVAAFGSNDLAIFFQDFDRFGRAELKLRLLYSAVDGTPGSDSIVGTPDRDFLFGGESGDTLTGGEQADELDGGTGNDTLDGGAGADRTVGGPGDDLYIVDDAGDVVDEKPGEGFDEIRTSLRLYTLPDNVEKLTGTLSDGQSLRGNAGDNVIVGGAGRDGLSDDQGGNDSLFGGDGDDGVSVSRYDTHAASNVLLDGQAGADVLTFVGSRYVDTVALVGGEGDDNLSSFRGGTVTIDGGAGADRVGLNFLGAQTTVTLGSGADLLSFSGYTAEDRPGGSITVTDMEVGASGDRVELLAFLVGTLSGWDPYSNAFASGHLRLVQSGADSLLQIDADGPRGPRGFVDLIRFQNREAGAFGQFNLGGYYADGSSPGGLSITGTNAPIEILWGTYAGDTILGLGGSDEIRGGSGDERIEGGSERDYLDGQFGNDVLLGGDGDDDLVDDSGNDQLFGEAGADTLFAIRNDPQSVATVLLDGGGDNDRLLFSGSSRGLHSATLRGGDGNDDLTVRGGGAIILDGGAGNDHIDINFSGGHYDVTLGAGYDQLYLGQFVLRGPAGDLYDTSITVADFSAGELGPNTDVLFVRDYLKAALAGWDLTSNPFESGHLQLFQDGADALIRIDLDGAAGPSAAADFIRFKNLDAATLTEYNLNALKPNAVLGGGGNDQIRGSGRSDRIEGGAGNDTFRLQDGGDDFAIGGEGNDIFFYGAALGPGDRNDGGAGTDVLVLQGNVSALLGADALAGIENVSVQSGSVSRWGDTANNRYSYALTATDGALGAGQQLTVNAQSLLAGESFAFDGSAETDGKFFIYAGRGADTLIGGAGRDIFFFEGDRFGAADKVDGGANADSVVIRGVGGMNLLFFGEDQLKNIESVSLNERFATEAAGHASYDLTLSNGNVAAGANLVINANSLQNPSQTVRVDGSAVQDGRLSLFGGAGNDVLIGGRGSDLLMGGQGRDALTGGAGGDTFQFRAPGESTVGAADAILDFAVGTDKIDLRFIDAVPGMAGDQAFIWSADGGFHNVAGELRSYAGAGGVWKVEGDLDGDGAADFLIEVSAIGGAVLGSSDFLL
jgi:Ca2+-binding RTX toxin-like protein